MNRMPYIAPKRGIGGFNCPYCLAYAKQTWSPAHALSWNKTVEGVQFTICSHCNEVAIWRDVRLIDPPNLSAPLPNVDLPNDIKVDFEEARQIADNSPRGAAALLRLCIQKLCVELGQKGKDINGDIGSLVKQGLKPKIQKSLDFVRVIGNEAVHPGELDLKDDRDTALHLFALVNIIADTMISQEKEVDELYNGLPQSKIDGINQRDGNSSEGGVV